SAAFLASSRDVFSFDAGGLFPVRSTKESGLQQVRMGVTAGLGVPVKCTVELEKTEGEPILQVPYHIGISPTQLPLRRCLLPWARPAGTKEAPVVARVPELEGGSWARGREVFFSDEAVCAKCHVVGGRGGRIGPDLSNLIHRDYASVLKDIREP